ncbi:MAG: hypothetical protein GVY19_02475 [Bacteroidetes bacterium]|jgi:hypothetical protein|nr:hypothetical protein [Bacteroidota bacterium]
MKKIILVGMIVLCGAQAYSQSGNVLEQLFTQPFPHPLSAESFINELGIFTKIKQEQTNNVHYPEVKDTLTHIKYFKSNIQLYEAQDKTLLVEFHIQNRRVKLIKDIHKGIKREELTKILNEPVPIEGDTVTFADAEQTVKMDFVFNKWNRLKAINYKSKIF